MDNESLPKLPEMNVDSQERDRLFRILLESDSNGLKELFGLEREHFTYKPIRRFAPYPIHQQLFIQQQQEQERRRQCLTSSSSNVRSTRSFYDVFYFQDIRPKYSDTFRNKIIQTVIAFINKHSTQLISNHDDIYEKCVICMSFYQCNLILRKLQCTHRFHRKCIDEWLVKSYLCPVCRTDLTGTEKNNKGFSILYYIWKQGTVTGSDSSTSANVKPECNVHIYKLKDSSTNVCDKNVVAKNQSYLDNNEHHGESSCNEPNSNLSAQN